MERQREYGHIANKAQTACGPVFPEADEDARDAKCAPKPVDFGGSKPTLRWFGR